MYLLDEVIQSYCGKVHLLAFLHADCGKNIRIVVAHPSSNITIISWAKSFVVAELLLLAKVDVAGDRENSVHVSVSRLPPA